jgi:hypothetical protein
MRGFLGSLDIQLRVIGAPIMRETYTRYGHANLGVCLDICGVPSIRAAGLRDVAFHPWPLLTRVVGIGVCVERLSADSSIPPIGQRMIYAVRVNISLLYNRNVTFDTVIARMAIEIVGNYGAVVFSYGLLYHIGAVDWPRDMPLLFLGYFYMTWWYVSVGLVLAYSERTVIFEKVWMVVSYIYLAVSGFMVHGFLGSGTAPADPVVGDALAPVLRDDPLRDLRSQGSRHYDISNSASLSLTSSFSACCACVTCGAMSSASDRNEPAEGEAGRASDGPVLERFQAVGPAGRR